LKRIGHTVGPHTFLYGAYLCLINVIRPHDLPGTLVAGHRGKLIRTTARDVVGSEFEISVVAEIPDAFRLAALYLPGSVGFWVVVIHWVERIA